jgi:hypothetical protein
LKRKWKIALAGFFLLAIGGAFAFYYSFTTKEYDISKDKEVKQIVDSKYEVILPGDTNNANRKNEENDSAANGEATKEKNRATNNNTSNDRNNASSNNSNAGTPGNNGNTTSENPKEVTADSIKEKYRPSFTNLQQQANAKVDALVAHAFQEYQTKKANNEDISYSYFYSKYNTAAKQLELKTDAAFETIYQALEAELKQHGFSADHAKEFRDEYEQAKKNRRNALIKKVIGKM